MAIPGFDIAGFLAERGRPASVAAVTRGGRPALATMWYAFWEEKFWFHTTSRKPIESPFLVAAGQGGDISVMVASFAPPDDVRQLRATGPAQLEPADIGRVRSLYLRYVDGWSELWEQQASSPDYRLWSMTPERGMAVAYPELRGAAEYRWSQLEDIRDFMSVSG
ncbi:MULTISPECIES: hypothetical protein [unclassified Streptomyces]|uniref:hypothetical protein n=1 Tax=unclassified Streptomyces TaxID=2593676 RepID=UPI002F91B7B5